MLDVHKIHFTLASSSPPAEIASELCRWIEMNAAGFSLRSPADYWATYARPSRFDPADIVFVKRVLQKGLPEEARTAAADWLFRRLSGHDERSLSRDFYLRAHELAEMIAGGMYVGSHGYSHRWLDTLDEVEQERELDQSLSFLETIGAPVRDWIMCYPFGGLNESLLKLLRRRDCAAGLTTRVAVAGLDVDDPLKLPRLDTNDLPLSASAGAR